MEGSRIGKVFAHTVSSTRYVREYLLAYGMGEEPG